MDKRKDRITKGRWAGSLFLYGDNENGSGKAEDFTFFSMSHCCIMEHKIEGKG